MSLALKTFMTDVLLCICNQLAADGRPVCSCCVVVAGEETPMFGCDCTCTDPADGVGTAWIKMVGANYPGQADTKCPAFPWLVTFEVGTYRCISAEIDCDTRTTDALRIYDDVSSLIAGLCCPALDGKNWGPSDVRIIGPMGQCVGVSVGFQVQVLNFESFVSP